jgi:hypothetical protein
MLLYAPMVKALKLVWFYSKGDIVSITDPALGSKGSRVIQVATGSLCLSVRNVELYPYNAPLS